MKCPPQFSSNGVHDGDDGNDHDAAAMIDFLNRHSQSHFIFQIKGFTYLFVCVETDIIVI